MADLMAQPTRSSGRATASLVCGILGFVGFGILTAIPAIILGTQAIREVDESWGRISGRGLATAGRILGIINVVLTLLGLIGLLLFLVVLDRSTDGRLEPVSEVVGIQRVVVDDVVNKPLAEADGLLAAKGLVVSTVDQLNDSVPAGTVIGQQPVAGSEVDSGSPVRLLVAVSDGKVVVPKVVNVRDEDAVRALAERGLVPDVVLVTNPAPLGVVLDQTPAAGTKVAPGTRVTIKVSGGPPPTVPGPPTVPLPAPPTPPVTEARVPVPSVLNVESATAQGRLEEDGFVVRVEGSSDPRGIVTRQFPSAGMRLERGSEVIIFVGTP